MPQKEMIMSPAVWFKGVDEEYSGKVSNITYGVLILGISHEECYSIARKIKSIRLIDLAIEGFVSSKCLFYNRESARYIAVKAGQISMW